MAAGTDERHEQVLAPEPPKTVRDRRVLPRGVLPRHVQMWLMVGIAVVILGVILITGRPDPTSKPASNARPFEPSLVSPERVRSYEQALAAEAARQQQALAQAQSQASGSLRPIGSSAGATASDPLTDEQRRREYQSLFADNVALSRRPTGRQPFNEQREAGRSLAPSAPPTVETLLQQLSAQKPDAGSRPAPVATAAAPSSNETRVAKDLSDAPPAPLESAPVHTLETGPIRPGDPVARLLEGTVIETVLLTRLDGTFAGPVTCLVTAPVYSHDRQSVVIPAGARVLGSSSPVQTWGDSRLAVSFHRLVMPDGRSYSLDRFKGLTQTGATGLRDSVNRHYGQVFGASLAIGALSGLAQVGTRSNLDTYTFGDAFRQGAGSSLAASAGRVLDRYLNVLPTVTIREGYRVKVYLTNDLSLPIYAATEGGVR